MSRFGCVVAWARRRPAAWVFLGFAILGFATAGDVPWSDDARFYVPAAKLHGQWIERLIRLDFAALSPAGIDHHFAHNAEHPPVGKLAMGLTWLVLHHWTGLLEEVQACRAAVTLLWALMAAAVFGLVRRYAGWPSGLFAALCLATMPRLLYHAHAETLDLPVAALYLLSTVALWRCLEEPSWRRGILAVVLFGLTLGTKLNAPFLLVAVAAYILVRSPIRWQRHEEGKRSDRGHALRLPPIPWVVIGMVLVSPLITWALWPWLWVDTTTRLNEYLLFHLQHYGIYFYFAGHLYGEQVAPWYAPLVMTASTLPLPIAFVAALGCGRPLLATLTRLPGLRRLNPTPGSTLETDPQARLGLFILLHAAVQLAAVSLPGIPKYGGIKLFLPLLPLIAVLAGFGFAACEGEIRRRFVERRRGLVIAVTALALLAPGGIGAVMYRDAWLSYYNSLAGGLRGATAAGYERQYYDLAYPEIAVALTELLPNGGSVAVAPNQKEYTPYLARWQRLAELPRGVRLARVGQADLLLLTHERRWAAYPDLMAVHRGRPLLYRFAPGGVPLFSIYDLRPGRRSPP